MKLIKSDNNDFFNAVLLNVLFNQRILKIYVSRFPQKSASQQFSTLIKIINVSWAENKHIRMISEGSCDTEDWSNDA